MGVEVSITFDVVDDQKCSIYKLNHSFIDFFIFFARRGKIILACYHERTITFRFKSRQVNEDWVTRNPRRYFLSGRHVVVVSRPSAYFFAIFERLLGLFFLSTRRIAHQKSSSPPLECFFPCEVDIKLFSREQKRRMDTIRIFFHVFFPR